MRPLPNVDDGKWQGLNRQDGIVKLRKMWLTDPQDIAIEFCPESACGAQI